MAIGTALAIVAVAGAGASQSKAKSALSHKKKANRLKKDANRLRQLQEKRNFLRNYRQAQALALSGAIAAGVGLESSLTQGTIASQRTQAETAVKESNILGAIGAKIGRQENKAANASYQAGVFSAISSTAASFMAFGAGAGAGSTAGAATTNSGFMSNSLGSVDLTSGIGI